MAVSTPLPERRLQILGVALDLFGHWGYHKTSMDAIAEKTGLAKGTLYWYFESKRGLLLALLRHAMQEMIMNWRTHIEGHDLSATEQLAASISFFRTNAPEVIKVFDIMIQARAAYPQDEEVSRVALELAEKPSQVLEQIIARGVAAHEFRQVPPAQVGFVLISLVAGVVLHMYTGFPQERWPALMDAIESLVFHGMLLGQDVDGPGEGVRFDLGMP